MNRLSLLLFAFLFVAQACGGCGPDNNIDQGSSGQIAVSPDPIAFAQVPIGQTDVIAVTILNVADEPLTVFEVQLRGRDGGITDGLELTGVPDGEFQIDANGEQILELAYTPAVGLPSPRAELVIVSSDQRFTRDDPTIVRIDTLGNEPRLEVVPNTVRFSRLPPGERATQEVTIRNIGSAPMKIWEEPAYGGGEDFRLETEPASYPLTLDIWDPDLAAEDPAKYELQGTVTYAPLGNGADNGEILVRTNDPSGEIENETGEVRALHVVDVLASADAPCIFVDGITRNFGQVPIGEVSGEVVTISNCGTQTLEVEDIVLTKNSDDDEFALDLGSLDNNDDGSLDTTLRLRPAEEETIFIKYTPTGVGSDQGVVTIFSNDPLQRELELELVGRGSEGICPTAVAGAYIRGLTSTPRQNVNAAPLEYIVLDGSRSSDEDGRVVSYDWNVVESPVPITLGATREDPNDEDPSMREFRLLTAGEYIIELTVRDNEGFTSCGDPARVAITAVPNEKVHVELTWTNPEDPDETDEVGSDVDAHLVKMGPGNWFETPYDVYFRNPNNSDGAAVGIWNPESPSLDIDDRDGGGPENIQMDDPSNCEWYAVGVHYYRQLFGTAYVTVRIYINAQLVYESINKPMTAGGQFWDVARIHWDSGQVYEYDNLFSAPPASMSPDVTPAMVNSGLCTAQDLYSVQ